MSEPITGGLRRKMDTLGWYDEDGNIVYTTGDIPVSEIACLVINSKTFGELCDAIDAIHANLERENESLRRELDRVLGESDDVQKTDGISDKCGSAMHEVSITDELRKWWVRRFPVMDSELHKDFSAIADRIDAEHESACAEAYGNGVMSVPIALDESAWVELPKDADGEPIHIGDVVEWSDGSTCEVVGIGDGGTLYYMDEMEGTIGWTNADGKRHHRPDSWERIIKDALTMPIHSKADVAQFVARCKALAGDAE